MASNADRWEQQSICRKLREALPTWHDVQLQIWMRDPGKPPWG